MRIPPPSDKDDDDADEFSDYEAEDDEDTDSDWQEVEHDDFAWEAAETMPLQLPSRLDVTVLKAHGLEDLLLQEKELREGHMNDALRALRNSLGDKAFLLRNRLRKTKGVKNREAAYRSIASKMRDVQRHVSTYKRGRSALEKMGYGDGWPPISKEDLRLSGDITDANRFGQNQEELPWFWRIGGNKNDDELDGNKKMDECMLDCFLLVLLN